MAAISELSVCELIAGFYTVSNPSFRTNSPQTYIGGTATVDVSDGTDLKGSELNIDTLEQVGNVRLRFALAR